MTKTARQYTPPAIKDHRGICRGKLVDSSGEQWTAAREAEQGANPAVTEQGGWLLRSAESPQSLCRKGFRKLFMNTLSGPVHQSATQTIPAKFSVGRTSAYRKAV